MRNYLLYYITFISLISLVLNEATFEIKDVVHTETQCDRVNGYFKFVIGGVGSGFSDEIRITLPLESPKDCKAVCLVSEEKMFCTMDSFIYDLSGAKVLKVFEEEPKFDNLRITNWVEHFKPEHRTLNSATNCEAEDKTIEPGGPDEPVDELIFAAFDAKNIEVLGCFRDKNNFSFELTQVDEEVEKVVSTKELEEDIYFDIQFEKPSKEKAFCVIPQKNEKGVYKVRCSIDYGGEIEVGGEADGTFLLNGKQHKIIFRGLLIPPTVVDEC